MQVKLLHCTHLDIKRRFQSWTKVLMLLVVKHVSHLFQLKLRSSYTPINAQLPVGKLFDILPQHLSNDKSQCVTNISFLSVSDVPAFLLYIVGTAIKKLTLDNNAESTLVQLNGSPPPLFLDFHYKENRLYWADGNSIHRSFLNDGTGKCSMQFFKKLFAITGSLPFSCWGKWKKIPFLEGECGKKKRGENCVVLLLLIFLKCWKKTLYI